MKRLRHISASTVLPMIGAAKTALVAAAAAIVLSTSAFASPLENAGKALFDCVEKKALFLADVGEEERRIPMMAFFICEKPEFTDYINAFSSEGDAKSLTKIRDSFWPELEPKIKKLVQERRARKI